MNNKKWDHLECPDCVHLKEHYEAEKDPSNKALLKQQLDDHYADMKAARHVMVS